MGSGEQDTKAAGTIAFSTLGCAKNEVDSDKMKALLADAGYRIVDDPLDAAVTVVNTCSFLTAAVEEGLDVIFDLLGLEPYASGTSKLAVVGCMPSRYGADLASELHEVAAFLPASEEDRIVEVVGELIGAPVAAEASSTGQRRYDAETFSYVKISDGCSRRCSYCMVPDIRGPYRSYPQKDILAEVGELVDAGSREIVYIAQDTGIWGRDLQPKSSLAQLLSASAAAFPDTWFRILYTQPDGIDDELLELMAATPNICSYLDIPLQHADADILHAMNRKGSPEELLELVTTIRAKVPDVTLRTTFMAGFPGESEEQFEELLSFVEEARFDCAGVFEFSPEEGSPAAEMDGQIPDEIRLERTQRLLDACDAVGFERTRRFIGRELEMLVEGFEETDAGLEAVGRSRAQAPDVDGLIHLPIADEKTVTIGRRVSAHVIDTFCYELEAEPVQDA
ncbi:MAG: 30S ribosomal protein S12 methylthiotransferase RimO [Coriobacteriaceae bacterium]|nr:30S ribosomal protein S12 methylthiotransferase RimO [Coriobacteriaceae bacterium]